MAVTSRSTGWFGAAKTVVPVGTSASAVNNLVTPIAAGASDTGEWEQVDATDVGVSCKTDQDGTLYFDFSNDGINADPFPPTGFSVSAGIHEFHTAVKLPRYFRVRFTNTSASAQTYLRVYCYYGPFRQPNSPLNSTLSADSDAIVTRSVNSDLDLALGRFGGMTEDAKFGFVAGMDNTDTGPRDVWSFADDSPSIRLDQKTFQTTAGTIYVASSDTGDNDCNLSVIYLDASGAVLTETVALAGRARVRVSDTGDGLDCNRAFETGSVATTGNIYVMYGTDTGSAEPNDLSKVLAYIPAGFGQTEQALDTVPAGKIYHMKRISVTIARSSGAAGSARIRLQTRLSGGTWLTKRRWHLQNGVFVKQLSGLVLPALTNIRLSVDQVSDADTNVTCVWHYDLVDV